MQISYRAIGVIHSPFSEIEGMPIQPAGAEGVCGWVEIFPEFQEGLCDLDGFSHMILLYHFHRANGYHLSLTPFLDDQPRGLFATRAPRRPNPIGLSVVKLIRCEATTLHIENVDILDGTPLLDIKPYIPAFEPEDVVRTGWLEKSRETIRKKRSDSRFR